MTKDRILELTEDFNTKIYFLDPMLDKAIIGLSSENKVVYSFDKMVEIFSKKMTEEEAIEHIDINIIGTINENSPIIVYEE